MNVFQKLTLKGLIKNKTRTIVTIIGIMLSAAMFTAVTTFTSSLQDYALNCTYYAEGRWYASLPEIDSALLGQLQTDAAVEDIAAFENVGYAKLGADTEKPYLYVIGMEAQTNLLPVHLLNGRFPETPEEIILPESMLTDGGTQYEIGEILTLEIGQRTLDGMTLTQDDGYYEDETFTESEPRTYTVVGICEELLFTSSSTSDTVITRMDTASAADASYTAYLRTVDEQGIYNYVSEIVADKEITPDYNTDLLTLLGVSQYDTFYSTMFGMLAVLVALILFGSVSLIYNAFSISVSERTKQFGLLRSIGATKKQLRRSVFFEAFSVSAVGIPLGLLVGIGGIGVTLYCLGDIFADMTRGGVRLELYVSPLSVVIAVAIALLTVLISAWIPSYRATRVSAVDAIRQSQDISTKARQVRTPKLTYRLFGLSGMLANKYYKRSRKKYRATILSLFMSVVLFISASSFVGYLKESVEGGFETLKFDLCYMPTSETATLPEPSILDALFESESHITGSSYVLSKVVELSVPETALTAEYKAYTTENPHAVVQFVEDSTYQEYLQKNGLDTARYMEPDAPLAIAIDGQPNFDYTLQKYVTIRMLNDATELEAHVQKEIDGYYFSEKLDTGKYLYCKNDGNDVKYLTEEEAVVVLPMQVGTILTELPEFAITNGSFLLLYPYSAFSQVIGGEPDSNAVSYFLYSEDHAASHDALREMLLEAEIPTNGLMDYAATVEQERNIILIVNVFAYGFIVLISLIAVANVFNTISTNISLRRREFAMLKSVGMTQKAFHRMLDYECLLYGCKALLYGLPVSVLVTWLIYRSINAGYMIGFHLPLVAILISVGSVFLVVFATMLYAMHKIKKDNPIDALKNENL